jgi:hypothetical protein
LTKKVEISYELELIALVVIGIDCTEIEEICWLTPESSWRYQFKEKTVNCIKIGWNNNTVLIMTDKTDTNSTMLDLAQQLSNGTDSKKFAVLGQLDNGIHSVIRDFSEMILKAKTPIANLKKKCLNVCPELNYYGARLLT